MSTKVPTATRVTVPARTDAIVLAASGIMKSYRRGVWPLRRRHSVLRFLAGIAMYFQTASTRDTDRRVVLAGLPTARLVAARLATGLTALVGLFAVLDSRDGDRRAALAGLRPGALLSARLGILTVEEQLAGRLRIAPRGVNSPEVLTAETRAMATEAWHVPPFNVYAATETGGIAAECRHHQACTSSRIS